MIFQFCNVPLKQQYKTLIWDQILTQDFYSSAILFTDASYCNNLNHCNMGVKTVKNADLI